MKSDANFIEELTAHQIRCLFCPGFYCDKWMVFDNVDMQPDIVTQYDELGKVLFNDEL